MDTNRQVELIRSWGFKALTSNDTIFTRSAPNNYTEVWHSIKPNEIDFYNSYGNLSHSAPIHWDIVAKHFEGV